MIHSEFQAMANEIQRIATATDFNDIKLLDGSLSGAHNGAGLTSTGAMKIHFGTGNDSAEDYYYVNIGDATRAGLGLSRGTSAGGINEDGATNGSGPGKPVTDEIIHLNEVTEDLVFMIGGHAGLGSAYCNHYKLKIYAEYDETFLADMGTEVRPFQYAEHGPDSS